MTRVAHPNRWPCTTPIWRSTSGTTKGEKRDELLRNIKLNKEWASHEGE